MLSEWKEHNLDFFDTLSHDSEREKTQLVKVWHLLKQMEWIL